MSERKTESLRSHKTAPLGGIIASLDRRYQRQLLMVLLALILTFILFPRAGSPRGTSILEMLLRVTSRLPAIF